MPNKSSLSSIVDSILSTLNKFLEGVSDLRIIELEDCQESYTQFSQVIVSLSLLK